MNASSSDSTRLNYVAIHSNEFCRCVADEGVYVDTYGKIIKNVVLQWGELPTSVGTLHARTSLTLHYFNSYPSFSDPANQNDNASQ